MLQKVGKAVTETVRVMEIQKWPILKWPISGLVTITSNVYPVTHINEPF